MITSCYVTVCVKDLNYQTYSVVFQNEAPQKGPKRCPLKVGKQAATPVRKHP